MGAVKTIKTKRDVVDYLGLKYSSGYTLANPFEDTWVNYRRVVKVVNAKNYHISTDANFKKINGNPHEEFANIKAKMFQSDSGSRYKILKGTVYRLSNHWGRVASCYWEINDYSYSGLYLLGKCAIKDFTVNDNFSGHTARSKSKVLKNRATYKKISRRLKSIKEQKLSKSAQEQVEFIENQFLNSDRIKKYLVLK